ncbi:hypothetical protein BN8_02263 [Fibrisoma limi BUZ 3]|uniref:DUF4190 domain-containing protein n=1 Tax=Fibrisoma limi BUZ 3 TaxID=1185876 RepID=I2GH12_9BACT|nr:DUF4190 domain-containing protein [Fibrisoma limi]CCH53187.1 hypothetical protein BN8_02263 [Fibrisoma limi BUZ 3]
MQTVFLRRISLLLTVAWLGTLSACQRAPYAYFTPTPHPAAQRMAVNEPAPAPPVDPTLTASAADDVPTPTKRVWEETTSIPTLAPATVAPKAATKASRPSFRTRLKATLLKKIAPPQCDQIVLRNGDVVEAKIKEVGVNEIKYKKCDRPDGPDYTISKRDVLSIKYTNGDVERFSSSTSPSNSSGSNRSSYDSPTNAQNDGPRTDPFAIVAIATGGLAILTGYGAFLLGAAAIVFGAISLTRIRREPNRFKGKGLALGGMVAGIVAAGVILLYLLL